MKVKRPNSTEPSNELDLRAELQRRKINRHDVINLNYLIIFLQLKINFKLKYRKRKYQGVKVKNLDGFLLSNLLHHRLSLVHQNLRHPKEEVNFK